jgi:hypothetical protein
MFQTFDVPSVFPARSLTWDETVARSDLLVGRPDEGMNESVEPEQCAAGSGSGPEEGGVVRDATVGHERAWRVNHGRQARDGFDRGAEGVG